MSEKRGGARCQGNAHFSNKIVLGL